MKKGLFVILLLLAACAPQQAPRAIELPSPEAYVVQPIVATEAPQPTPNRACMDACTIERDKCRYRNMSPFQTCSNAAKRDLSLCLKIGDDAYCRFEYSKSREKCFTAYMGRCDILFNTCSAKC